MLRQRKKVEKTPDFISIPSKDFRDYHVHMRTIVSTNEKWVQQKMN